MSGDSSGSGSGSSRRGSSTGGRGEERDRDSTRWGHRPVLLDEVVDAIHARPGAIVCDATVGTGGHAEAILRALGPQGLLVGIDRDEEALERARDRLQRVGHPFSLYRGVFTRIREALLAARVAPEGGLDGILLDLGVSSLQLDLARRGFSFQKRGPLDMRMSPGQGRSAAEWLREASVEEIEHVLRQLGEEPAAARIARAIDRRRRQGPIETTTDLAKTVESVVPRGRRRIHPATRTFQAIRVHINEELDLLRSFLDSADRYLRAGGRLVVLSYHSLEDRIVKRLLREREKEGIFCRVTPALIRPGEKEVGENPRARSARLRVAERRVDA